MKLSDDKVKCGDCDQHVQRFKDFDVFYCEVCQTNKDINEVYWDLTTEEESED